MSKSMAECSHGVFGDAVCAACIVERTVNAFKTKDSSIEQLRLQNAKLCSELNIMKTRLDALKKFAVHAAWCDYLQPRRRCNCGHESGTRPCNCGLAELLCACHEEFWKEYDLQGKKE